MTYRVCEDAPCCGCCGTSLYGPAESALDFDFDAFAEALWSDPMESDYDPDPAAWEGGEDAWLDGSYEM
jgi:hypothetical protein